MFNCSYYNVNVLQTLSILQIKMNTVRTCVSRGVTLVLMEEEEGAYSISSSPPSYFK